MAEITVNLVVNAILTHINIDLVTWTIMESDAFDQPSKNYFFYTFSNLIFS